MSDEDINKYIFGYNYGIADLYMTQDERDIAEAMRELDAEFPGYRDAEEWDGPF